MNVISVVDFYRIRQNRLSLKLTQFHTYLMWCNRIRSLSITIISRSLALYLLFCTYSSLRMLFLRFEGEFLSQLTHPIIRNESTTTTNNNSQTYTHIVRLIKSDKIENQQSSELAFSSIHYLRFNAQHIQCCCICAIHWDANEKRIVILRFDLVRRQ